MQENLATIFGIDYSAYVLIEFCNFQPYTLSL